MPYRIMIDGKSRIHLVYVNRGVPKGNRDFFKEDLVFGGYADLFQESNLRILTQEFETVLNFFEMFTAAHLADGVYWYSGFIVTPKEFIRLGGNTNTKGSYGAYPEEIIGIYGEDKYLIDLSDDWEFMVLWFASLQSYLRFISMGICKANVFGCGCW